MGIRTECGERGGIVGGGEYSVRKEVGCGISFSRFIGDVMKVFDEVVSWVVGE